MKTTDTIIALFILLAGIAFVLWLIDYVRKASIVVIDTNTTTATVERIVEQPIYQTPMQQGRYSVNLTGQSGAANMGGVGARVGGGASH